MLNHVVSPLREHIPNLVKIHLKSFPGFFLTFLGERFLFELYDAILLDSSGIEFIYQSEGEIYGFVAGTDQPSGFYKRLLVQRWWRFALAAIPATIRKPSILPRLLRAFSMPAQPLPAPNCGTLMSIAVAPSAQGKGVGKILVRAFLLEASKRGLEYVNLTTDADNNDTVNVFYVSQGFRLHRTFTTPEGRRMNEYLYWLPELNKP